MPENPFKKRFNRGIEPQLADLNLAPPTDNAVIVKLRWDTYWQRRALDSRQKIDPFVTEPV